MKKLHYQMKEKFAPVLLGGDLNCYSVARSFYEAYGVTSYIIGRYKLGVTQHSRFIKFIEYADIDKPDKFVVFMHKFGELHEDEGKLILMGCGDDYVYLVSHFKNELKKHFVTSCPSAELFDYLSNKANFYTYCEEIGLPYPKTVIYAKGDELKIPFDYPVVIKPAVSNIYWKHPFEGIEKVFTAYSYEEAKSIVEKIHGAGYPEKIIIQDRIPGDDSYMYTMSTYSDKDGKVRYMTLGHIILEEHTPKGTGNDAAIITVEDDALCAKIKNFLESIHYVGFTNWDIKYDRRDNEYKAFEANCRQGRSNYHVTAAGDNLARMIVEDIILGTAYTGCHINRNQIYWRVIPDKVVFKYAKPETVAAIKELKRDGEAYNTLLCKDDLHLNPLRAFFVFENQRRYIEKYKKYYHPENME